MNAADWIRELADTDIRLSVNGNYLHVEAKPGTVTPELRQRLTEHKADLLATLKAGCGDAELKRRCVAACEGLPTKPGILYEARTAEDRAAQCSGGEGPDTLRAFARSLADRSKPALAPKIAAAYERLKRELAEHPTLRTAVEVLDADADPVLLALAVRNAGYAVVRIPKARYDGFKLLEIVHRWNREPATLTGCREG